MTRVALRAILSLAFLTLAHDATADEPAPPQPAESQAQGARTPASEERAVAKARELLERARFLDETATAEGKAVVDLDKRLPALRLAARAARDRVGRAREGDTDRPRALSTPTADGGGDRRAAAALP